MGAGSWLWARKRMSACQGSMCPHSIYFGLKVVPTADDINPALLWEFFGIFLITGNAGLISSTVVGYFRARVYYSGTWNLRGSGSLSKPRTRTTSRSAFSQSLFWEAVGRILTEIVRQVKRSRP